MPGDVVRRMIPGKDTQRGYCHEIFVKADVKVCCSRFSRQKGEIQLMIILSFRSLEPSMWFEMFAPTDYDLSCLCRKIMPYVWIRGLEAPEM